MKLFADGLAKLIMAAVLAGLLWSPAARAQPSDSASVSVTLRVAPIAQLEFPEGFEFVLEVPEWKNNKHSFIRPVLIPFKVRGNARAVVSARPEEFLRIDSGYYLGEALKEGGDRHKHQKGEGHDKGRGKGHGEGQGDAIGYNVVVQFPVASWLNASLGGWDGFGAWLEGFASLPGANGEGTPPLSADVSQYRNGALGMIYIVAKHNWTEDGGRATSGEYRGAVQVTVTAEER